MGKWVLVAEGTNFENLETLVKDRVLTKGTRVRCEMDLNAPVAWGFDVLPNWAWPAPEGMDVVEIWGEGSRKGIVELEADPAWLFAVVAFAKAHWLWLVVGGAILAATVILIRVYQWLADMLPKAISWGLIACLGCAAAYIGYKVVSKGGT